MKTEKIIKQENNTSNMTAQT